MAVDPYEILGYLDYWAAHEETFVLDEIAWREIRAIADFLFEPQARPVADPFGPRARREFFDLTRACRAKLKSSGQRLDPAVLNFMRLRQAGEHDQAEIYLRGEIERAQTEYERRVLTYNLRHFCPGGE